MSDQQHLELTDEQRVKVQEYIQKWMAIGRDCGECDFERAKKCVVKAYQATELPPPTQFYLYSGPVTASYGAIMIERGLDPYAEMPPLKELDQETVDLMTDHARNMAYGSQDAPWLSFYDFVLNELKHECCRPLEGLIELAQCCGWWAPYDDVAILQHRHSDLHINARNELHRDGGMAMKYRDGYGLYFLNGVRVPPWLALTPGEQLDPKSIFTEENVEIRRELVRKIGPERLLYKLDAKVVHEEKNDSSQYVLLEMEAGAAQPVRALKMLNPSVPELWHVEFVPPTCNTVTDALLFRNGFTPSQIDDENGAEWIQQGDVILKPLGATKFRLRPSQLA